MLTEAQRSDFARGAESLIRVLKVILEGDAAAIACVRQGTRDGAAEFLASRDFIFARLDELNEAITIAVACMRRGTELLEEALGKALDKGGN